MENDYSVPVVSDLLEFLPSSPSPLRLLFFLYLSFFLLINIFYILCMSFLVKFIFIWSNVIHLYSFFFGQMDLVYIIDNMS